MAGAPFHKRRQKCQASTHLIHRLERLPKRSLPDPWSRKVALPYQVRVAEDDLDGVLYLLLWREMRATDDAAGLDDVEEDLDWMDD